jgi:hypothetical protein
VRPSPYLKGVPLASRGDHKRGIFYPTTVISDALPCRKHSTDGADASNAPARLRRAVGVHQYAPRCRACGERRRVYSPGARAGSCRRPLRNPCRTLLQHQQRFLHDSGGAQRGEGSAAAVELAGPHTRKPTSTSSGESCCECCKLRSAAWMSSAPAVGFAGAASSDAGGATRSE